MTILYDKCTYIMTSTYEDMKTMINVCGLGRIPAKDVRFLISIKGEKENEKNK